MRTTLDWNEPPAAVSWAVASLLTISILLTASLASPQGITHADSSVFEYIGMVMQQGGFPYVDAFDHKGPLLYLINWMGMALAGWRGPLLFEALALETFFLYAFRTARLCASTYASVASIVACGGFLSLWFDSGNLTEEYALPWMAMAMFIVLRYVRYQRLRRSDAFIFGCSLAMVLLLRPNMIAIWAVGFPVMLCGMERVQKRQAALWTFLGLFSGLLPFVLWLGCHHALEACWESYILFNLHYTAHYAEGSFVPNRPYAFFQFFFLFGSAYSLFLAGCAARKQGTVDRALAVCAAMNLASNVSISISGTPFPHYGMVPIPTFSYLWAYFLAYLERNGTITPSRLRGLSFVFMTALFLFSVTRWTASASLSVESVTATSTYIQAHTKPTDKISVWGNMDILYVRSQRLSSSRYSYQVPLGNINPEIFEQYFRDIEQMPPRILVINIYFDGECPELYRNRVRAFLRTHGYRPVESLNDNGILRVFERIEDSAGTEGKGTPRG